MNVKIEGIVLTPQMINNIKIWQDESRSIDCTLRTFDDAIMFIASSPEPDDVNEAIERLGLLSSLCHLKNNIALFDKPVESEGCTE